MVRPIINPKRVNPTRQVRADITPLKIKTIKLATKAANNPALISQRMVKNITGRGQRKLNRKPKTGIYMDER